MDFHVDIDLATIHFTPELLRFIPKATARMYRVLPIGSAPDCIRIALADPSDLEVLHELYFVLGRAIEPYVADKHQLDTFIERMYPN
jgi:type IV pilus assembly protein PilB